MMPLFEAKMIHHYDTRWATYEPDGSTRLMTPAEKAAHVPPMPRYWVAQSEVEFRFGASATGPARLFAWRGIARTTDARTAIGTLVPRLPGGGNYDLVCGLTEKAYVSFAAAFSSFVQDFVVRQKLSNMHLQFSVAKQLPIPSVGSEVLGLQFERPIDSWIGVRVDRLNNYIADDNERAQVRAELNAYIFHLYGISRDDVGYIMETFPIVKHKDLATHGDYRTKQLILACYDAMAAAILSGATYCSPFDQEIRG